MLSAQGVAGETCRWVICGRLGCWYGYRPVSSLWMEHREPERSSLIFWRENFVLLAQMPPFRPELCREGVGLSDLVNFLLPVVPLRYRVVD